MTESLTNRAERLARHEPVVIMARGHSGTRILSWALEKLGIRMGASDDVATGDSQDRRFTRTIKRICLATLTQPPTAVPRPALLASFHKALDSYIHWLGDPPSDWGWKFPETYLIPRYVTATFPKAKMIHMIRDGRDIAFKDHLTDDPGRRLGRKLLKRIGAVNLPHPVQAARSWAFQVKRFKQFQDASSSAIHQIRFEELCTKPLPALEAVCRFLDREMTDECRQYLDSSIMPDKISQYKHEDPQIVRRVEDVIADDLKEFGYDD